MKTSRLPPALSLYLYKQSTDMLPNCLISHSIRRFLFSVGFLCLMTSLPGFANNLTIGPPTLSGNNITFTISWNNSWFLTVGSANYDAAWVFVKRQSCTDNLWRHAPVSTANVHSVTGGVLQVDPVTDGRGVFIRRFASGSGNIATATVTLVLQTATNSLDNFQVHGMEMVFIPQGDFAIGSGSTGNNLDCNFSPITITSAMQSAGLPATSFNGPCGSGAYFQGVPSTFPLGWNSFYAMKYEISQEQYAAFLNTLTYSGQSVRMTANPNSAAGTPIFGTPIARNGLEIQTPGTPSNIPAVIGSDLNNNNVYNENGDGQNIACNFLGWPDLIAYLDWAALRPMTEFEFEKLCRGTDSYFPTLDEYVWGTTSQLSAGSSSLNNAGTNSETSTSFGAGLSAFNGTAGTGPLRCGFAAGVTTRQQAGAGFYGNMDLGGNVWEQCIGGSCNTSASSFTTANGDGNLTSSGFCDVLTWPANGGNCTPTVLRGGAWNDAISAMQIGRRTNRGSTTNSRFAAFGGRGVRSL